jgi:hypothetical protein
MLMKKIIVPALFFLVTASVFAQRVKRKGVTPIDISKNKRQPGNGVSQPEFTVEQLTGKWQEVRRTYKNNSPENFTDTNFLNFTSPGKVTTRAGNNQSSIIGDALIEQPGNTLLAAADVYTILSLNDSIMVLDNQEYFLQTFKKTSQFWFETFGKLSVKQDVYEKPVSVTIAQLLGKWGIYKKEAKPGTIHPPTSIIYYLKITKKTGDDSAAGEITFYQSEQSKVLPCKIKITSTGIDITAGEFNWSLFVYKADGKEFVFGDINVMLYFAKPL